MRGICNYWVECHAFSGAEKTCMRREGYGCRMKDSYDLQYGVIKKIDTDENLQVEYGDLGLIARMKEVSRRFTDRPMWVMKDGKEVTPDFFGSRRRLQNGE